MNEYRIYWRYISSRGTERGTFIVQGASPLDAENRFLFIARPNYMGQGTTGYYAEDVELLPPAPRKSARYYVAYGSNLNLSQMKNRCPRAKLVGTGYIKGYELSFKGLPIGRACFATIDKRKGCTVPVGLFSITAADERALDIYEGYPRHYHKDTVTVSLAGGKTVKAMVYIMNSSAHPGSPSPGYIRTIEQGYDDCGLDRTYLNEALDRCP